MIQNVKKRITLVEEGNVKFFIDNLLLMLSVRLNRSVLSNVICSFQGLHNVITQDWQA